MRSLGLAVLCLLLTVFPVGAQVGTEGSYFGTVTDSSGASVPNAEVSVTHLATGLVKNATTGTDGNFNIAPLPIGKYSIVVKANGFKTWELSGSELTVGDRHRITPVLSVGEVTESVSVEANAGLLQTEKSSAETIVQVRQIRSAAGNAAPAGVGLARSRHAVFVHAIRRGTRHLRTRPRAAQQ